MALRSGISIINKTKINTLATTSSRWTLSYIGEMLGEPTGSGSEVLSCETKRPYANPSNAAAIPDSMTVSRPGMTESPKKAA